LIASIFTKDAPSLFDLMGMLNIPEMSSQKALNDSVVNSNILDLLAVPAPAASGFFSVVASVCDVAIY
jgi:hypothetical protein